MQANIAMMRSMLPQWILTVLPMAFFLSAGVTNVAVILFFCSLIFAGQYKRRWQLIKNNPLFVPVMALFFITTGAAIYLDNTVQFFWSSYAHYQIYLLLLIFISVGPGAWQARAKISFYVGAVIAATIFYINFLSYLPAWDIFKSYILYQGNKSILLGALLALASGKMLFDLIFSANLRYVLLRVIALLYVMIALLFFSQTRTGIFIFGLLCALVFIKYISLSWRGVAIVGLLGALLFGAWQASPYLRDRLLGTVYDIQAFGQHNKISGEGVRIPLYQQTIQIIQEKPLLGHGLGSWLPLFSARTIGTEINGHTTPHNDYLLYATELGLIGVSCLLWILGQQFFVARRMGGDDGMWLTMVSVTIVVTCMFNAGLRDIVFGIPFMMLLSIALSRDKGKT